jgi:hypothetical protein
MASEKLEQWEAKNRFEVHEQDGSPDQGSPTYHVAAHETAWGETTHDVADMKRLGKKQEFKVLIRPNFQGDSKNLTHGRGTSISYQRWGLFPYTWQRGNLS